MKPLNLALFFLYFVQVRPWTIHKTGGEGRRKSLQNAQPQKKLLRSIGDWGVPQQAASGKVDSQKHRLLVQGKYDDSPFTSMGLLICSCDRTIIYLKVMRSKRIKVLSLKSYGV